jgi:4-hydroxy-tetrahydrodipicolinate reductase
MSEIVRVVHVGMGPIGSEIARVVSRRPELRAVGAVDTDPAKIGRDLADFALITNPSGVQVRGSLQEALPADGADLLIQSTRSRMEEVHEQLSDALDRDLDVISTCEELVFPWEGHAEIARALDGLARQKGRRVLGVGINPGLLMDVLPLTIAGICHRIERIEIHRVIDAAKRRENFQRKVGVGLDVSEFNAEASAGRLGHVGLRQSMALLLNGLGEHLERFEESLEPLVAVEPIRTEGMEVAAGCVRGSEQVARGSGRRSPSVEMRFLAAIGNSESEVDRITIVGLPSLDLSLSGAHGDRGTAAVAVNAIGRLRAAGPGLHTLGELGLVAPRR